MAIHAQVMLVVHCDNGCPATSAQALDRSQRDVPVLRGLADRDAELALEGLDDVLRARERARDVRADLDDVPADGLGVEHVVEGRDRMAVRGCQLERVGRLAERLLGEPAAVSLLRELERGQHGGERVGIPLPDRLHLVVEGRALIGPRLP